ncbi:2-oxoacid dehydrogenase acyltransferase catalytic domain-containing protein [Caenorhabditis elegans]|uniref:2-oxoacid dehydrogenase acyltransferase catalytic domain-containing protein n=1 Tax=Caenorhabditis elegans TaxID=6239 RepID=O45279_CAEEL|nr:2-oxoacid dehydrogenase acyltransferase catalytic domain-containing protein [Caenorhabditis elegans]CAB02813.1 2-oxoacid dehydrogenase acyltransferase catalytic domain-containing protein [Caenorhabditis elegans]|eukprot:NP_001255950.1 DihydroLipoyllysine-residue AcetylTransferase [Caenorhabditis elegans]
MLAGSQALRHLSTAAQNQGACGPAVKLLLIQYGLENRKIDGTGPKNKNILKGDVMKIVEAEKLKPVAHHAHAPKETHIENKSIEKKSDIFGANNRSLRHHQDIPLSNIRATIAKRLTASKQQIPHEYQGVDVRIDDILALRQKLKKSGTAVSLNDFIIKAAALALRSVPTVNVRWTPEGIGLGSVDISVAVATPTGLITPIVENSDILGVLAISSKVKELSGLARESKLKPQQFQGGSFTISNLGMFGSVTNFTAIINPPQCAILTIGGTRSEVVSVDGQLETQKLMGVNLCFDGRAISEECAKRFLLHFSESLSDPELLIAEPLSPELDFDFSRLL